MNRKSIKMLLAGLIIGGVLNSGLFDEAGQARDAKVAWIASSK